MLTGRFQLAAPGEKLPAEDGRGAAFGRAAGPPADAAAWTAGADVDAGRRRVARVRYRDPTQMGKVYLCRRAWTGRSRAWDGDGPDADDPALTLEVWRERIRRHPGELKNLLKNQAFVAGIGNAYSRRDPVRRPAAAVPQALDARRRRGRRRCTRRRGRRSPTRSSVLRERVPPTFEKQVRDFLAVHNKGGQPCPRCGTKITEVKPGGFLDRRTAGVASAEGAPPCAAASGDQQDLADLQHRVGPRSC